MSRTYKDTPDWVRGYRKMGRKPPKNYRSNRHTAYYFRDKKPSELRWSSPFRYSNEWNEWLDYVDEPYAALRGNKRSYVGCTCCYWIGRPFETEGEYRAHVRDMIRHERYDDILPYKRSL